MVGKNTSRFIEVVGQKDLLQRKYLITSMEMLNDQERLELENIIGFYMFEGYQLEEIAESYQTLIKDTMKEQLFFLKNDYNYRYNQFKDVAENVYYNKEYMRKYMIGLGVSQYIWRNHIGLRRWFEEKICSIKCNGGGYLEIGPGHGNYFVTAMKQFECGRYDAVDISETSVSLTQKFISYTMGRCNNTNYSVRQMDFFDMKEEFTYDIIVMGEVLEHVELPLPMLNKIGKLANNDAKIFISTVINAPEKDHIYLFRNKEEIFQLCDRAQLSVLKYQCFTANDITIKEAEEMKSPMIIGMLLEKN